MKRTLCLLKCDLVHRNLIGAAIGAIESKFKIEKIEMRQLTLKEIEEFYIEHKSRSFFPLLVQNVITTPVVILILQGGDNVVCEFRDYIGATDPTKSADRTLRQRFGLSLDANSFHGSDSDASALREIKVLYPNFSF